MKWNLLNEIPSVVRALSGLVSAEPERAARDLIYLVSSPEVEVVSGRSFKGKKLGDSSAYSKDPEVQQRLWDVSTKLCKI